MKPSVGRIVYYLQGGENRAALIVRVLDDKHVNLAVFDPDGTSATHAFMRNVPLADAKRTDGCWAWPERV